MAEAIHNRTWVSPFLRQEKNWRREDNRGLNNDRDDDDEDENNDENDNDAGNDDNE